MTNQKNNSLKKTINGRLNDCFDELKWLYMELYPGNDDAFEFFVDMLKRNYEERKADLRSLDKERIDNPDWYRSNKMMGMMLYADRFAGNLQGVEEKLPYIKECGINYLHLMPLLKSTPGKSDGGYAVADFREVQPDLGTMEDLEHLADVCHNDKISLCLDFVLNHTSEDHEWARAARAGDPTARSRYFFYDNWDIPNQFEEAMPDVFPTTAPGNFTWYDDCKQVIMTTFHPYQWDLNYANPMVLNDMTDNLLYLTNRGIDVIRLDAIPYIWKELGTSCRNLHQVHQLSRILHLCCEIVCPGVLLLGEVVMPPAQVNAYFGPADKPECHMLYNVTTMCSTWHSLATRDVRLLRNQLNQVAALPQTVVFQNYLRCHDDIGWGLDYDYLKQFGIDEVRHKKFLNDWFTGNHYGSWSAGELYNDDWRIGDARLCGTTASLCGIERASNEDELRTAVQRDLMLHAFLMTQSGIPVIYSGDEIAELNDYSYHNDSALWDDSRNVHRGPFPWQASDMRHDKDSAPGIVFNTLRKMEKIRAKHELFRTDAHMHTCDTWSDHILGIYREYDGQGMMAYFNFSEYELDVYLPAGRNMMSGRMVKEGANKIEGYGFYWILVK